jgi:cell division protein FtsB
MNRTEIATLLETLPLDIEQIAAADVKAKVMVLLNLVETLVAENEKLRDEQQKLQDEINRLKERAGEAED